MRDSKLSLGGGLGITYLVSSKLLEIQVGLGAFHCLQNTDRLLLIFTFVAVGKIVSNFKQY